MPVWNKPPEEEPKKPSQTTKEQAELLRAKIEIEDELKNNPDSTTTEQFYDQMTKPFKQPNKDDKEKDVTPPMKKLVSNIVLFVLACWLLKAGIAMLAEIWLPLLFLAIFGVCLIVGWRIRKAKKDWW